MFYIVRARDNRGGINNYRIDIPNVANGWTTIDDFIHYLRTTYDTITILDAYAEGGTAPPPPPPPPPPDAIYRVGTRARGEMPNDPTHFQDLIATGASYPLCRRNNVAPCQPRSFTSATEFRNFAIAHQEIPVMASNEEHAWRIVERQAAAPLALTAAEAAAIDATMTNDLEHDGTGGGSGAGDGAGGPGLLTLAGIAWWLLSRR